VLVSPLTGSLKGKLGKFVDWFGNDVMSTVSNTFTAKASDSLLTNQYLL